MTRVLPSDIIIEILLWLPVTSLLRFKRVSKSWKILITSPMFAYRHINLQNSLVSTSNRFVIIKHPNSRHLFRVNFDTRLSNAIKLALPKGFFKSSYDRIVLGGSCNGLICLYSFVTGKIILLNPINYTYFKATIAGQPFKARSVAFGFDSIGFGFDSINNDYKVVCTSYYNAIVYSFKKKSWRYIDPNNGRYIFYINEMVVGALVNNHLLHWIVSLHDFPKKMIACFDLCMEQWSLINLPIDFQMQHRHKLSVHENGCLCLSIVHCQDLVDVWILKDYAVEESWVKIRVSINYPLFVKYHRFCYNKEAFPCLYALLKSEKWYAEICTGSLVTLRHGRKFSWKHHLSKAFSCLAT